MPAPTSGRNGRATIDTDFTDAIAMLKADHRKVEDLFAEYEGTNNSSRKAKLIGQITQELIVHTELEERLFYPACEQKVKDEDLLNEAQVEHDGAKVLILDLLKGDMTDEYRDAKVTVLKEMIKHHVKEEEKRQEGLFAKARAADVDVDGLLGEMLALKEELLAARALPMPEPKSFDLQALPA